VNIPTLREVPTLNFAKARNLGWGTRRFVRDDKGDGVR